MVRSFEHPAGRPALAEPENIHPAILTPVRRRNEVRTVRRDHLCSMTRTVTRTNTRLLSMPALAHAMDGQLSHPTEGGAGGEETLSSLLLGHPCFVMAPCQTVPPALDWRSYVQKKL